MLKKHIEQWLGEDKSYTPFISNEHPTNEDIDTYNKVISELKSRIPELEEKIVGEIVEKIKAHNFQFFTAKTGLIFGNTMLSQIGEEKVCIEARELIEFLDIINSLKGDKELETGFTLNETAHKLRESFNEFREDTKYKIVRKPGFRYSLEEKCAGCDYCQDN